MCLHEQLMVESMPTSFSVEKLNLTLNLSYLMHTNIVFYIFKMVLSCLLKSIHDFLY